MEQFSNGVATMESIFPAIVATAVVTVAAAAAVVGVSDSKVVGHYLDSIVQRPFSVELKLAHSAAPPGLATAGFLVFVC